MRKNSNMTIGDRVLAQESCGITSGKTIQLEDVRKHLREVYVRQRPEDYDQDLRDLEVTFKLNSMTARWKGDNDKARMLLTSTGASQLANMVLPGHFFKGLRSLAEMDDAGAQLATSVWRKFNDSQSENQARVRTVNMKLQGEVYQVIRAVVSTSYATYSNLEFVDSIMGASATYSQLPVLNWQLSDNGMRIRFLGMDDTTFALANLDEEVLKAEPFPMVEAWNSEVARRRVGFRAGMIKLGSTIAIPHWNRHAEYAWIHRGNTDRIQSGVEFAFTELFQSAEEVVNAYRRAMEVLVEHPINWIKVELEKLVSQRVQEAVMVKVKGQQTMSAGVQLSDLVDAIASAAQQEEDMFDQSAVEEAASRVLVRGLDQAKNNIVKVKG